MYNNSVVSKFAFISCFIFVLFTHLNAKGSVSVLQIVQLDTPEGNPAKGIDYHLYKSTYGVEDQNRVVSGKTDEKGQFRFQRIATKKDKSDRYILITHCNKLGYNFYNIQVWRDELVIFELKKNQEKLKLRFLDSKGNPVSKISFSLKQVTMLKSDWRNDFNSYFNIPRISDALLTISSDELGIVRLHGLPPSCAVYLDHEDDRYAKLEGRYNTKYQLKPSVSTVDVSLLTAAQISGSLMGVDGKPVQGVKIECLPDRDRPRDGCGDVAVSDENGFYTLNQLRPNSYSVQAYLSDEQARECAAPLLRGKLSLGQSLNAFDIQLQQGCTLKGYFKDARSGVAIANESLALAPSGEKHVDASLGSFSIPVSEDGYFEVKVPTGEYHLYYTGLLEGYDRDSIIGFKFESKNGGVIEHDVMVQPLLEEHYVTGVVVDLDGKPIRGASVRGGSSSYASVFPSGITDSEGKFKIYVNANIDEKGLLLCAIKDGQISQMKEVKRGNVYTLEIRTKEMAALKGRIVDAEGEPVEGVEVEYRSGYYFGDFSESVVPKVTTGVNGLFSFNSVWPHESSNISMKKDGYRSGWESLEEIKPGVRKDIGDVALKIKGDLVVTGQVLDSDDVPMRSIVFSYGKNQPDNHQRTKEDGSFELKNLSKGSVYIGAKDVKYKSEREITGKWVEAGSLNVVLKSSLAAPSETVRGRVLAANGKPASGVLVKTHMLGQPRLNTQTDLNGYFVLEGLYPDWLNLHIKNSLNDEDYTEVRTKPGLENEVYYMKVEPKEDELEVLPEGFSWIGKMAPKVKVDRWMNIDGYPEQNKGKVRIIDFWHIQCVPCVANLPKMEKFWQENKGRELEMISLHSAIREEEFEDFLKKQRKYKKYFSMPFGFESEGNPIGGSFQVKAAPTYCVIDASGVVQYFDSADWPAAQKKALELLDSLESSRSVEK